ncbi:Fic family protein [Siphonobacter aquaeclarae]|uniref:Fic family protein n=1 Tax=Siphonobacter aquaeclarae TaxID=563176 RepID=A0A1G9MFN1_9BACT|nr:Fic family protein [Siphonobacter aquaeclarae]SDL73076.1 Fic family protein [Siphonobacter aquaeclarae]
MYIHQLPEWPAFSWDQKTVSFALAAVRHKQGRLVGRMEALGFPMRDEAVLQTLTQDVVKTSEIEGELLNPDQVRSSIARRLEMDIGAPIQSDRQIDGAVDMILDATQHYSLPLTKDRLMGWHTSLFPTGRSGLYAITTGEWRRSENGPMQVVSGRVGREITHFEAPEATLIPEEMDSFLTWFNAEDRIDPVLKAALAHLWFVTIHPFDDGNGRIARALTDLMLARSDESAQRFYSMSAQIRLERKQYYEILETTQKGDLTITGWLLWFFHCLDLALSAANDLLDTVLSKARFWETISSSKLNDRQKIMINKLLDGFEGKLRTAKWAKIMKVSTDTALRDILGLVEQGILLKENSGGRSTSYILANPLNPPK